MSVKLPLLVMVTPCDASTPFVNAAVVSGAPVSEAVDVMVAEPEKFAVLLFASRAVS